MTASSVTGVGHGSAEDVAKGVKDRGNMDASKILGPRVMAAGTTALVSTAATVNLPATLPAFTPASIAAYTPARDYVVLARAPSGHSVTVAKVESDDDADGHNDHFKGFTLSGTGTDVIDWVVIRVGH